MKNLSLPRHLLEMFLERLISPWTELLDLLETEATKDDGEDPVTRVTKMLRDDGVTGWATLYLDPSNSVKTLLLAVMPPEAINKQNQELSCLSVAERSAWATSFLGTAVAACDIPEGADVGLQKWARDLFTEDLNATWAVLKDGFVWAGFLNVMAVLVHKKNMYQLVSEAMGGNDESFLKAIQIDKTVLEDIPYFVERNRRAADRGEFKFQRRIHDYRNRPITRTRVQYSKLLLVLVVLDQMGVLGEFENDLEHFAQLCQRLRIYGPSPDKEPVDVEAFEQRLKDFKRTHRYLAPRPTERIVVKDVSSPNSHP